MEITAIATSVADAFFDSGGRNAGTPFDTASTPVMAVHPFANGCTAMTGVEAVSNGVPAFRPPESKNASATLVAMAVISIRSEERRVGKECRCRGSADQYNRERST